GPADSALELMPDEPVVAAPKPAPDAGKKASDAKASSSDILAGALSESNATSDIHLGTSDILGSSDVLGGSSIFGGSSDVLAGSSQVLINPSESQVSPELAESQTIVKKGSDPALVAGSGLSLEGEDSDIFGGPKSDVTHRPGDSGILLIDPGDSGLSLDQPLDLSTAGSGVMETTEFRLGDDSGSLQADDDFLLTPLEESAEDESDSGSQVIMLDTEGEGDFGEATATLLGSQIPGLLEEEATLGAFPSGATGGAAAAAVGAPVLVPAPREVPFPGWMVMLLAACTLTLGLSGAMAYDLVRNMWSWNEPYALNSQLMDLFVGK
ncbi:MAG TPA: hypothetical protein VG713_09190, partial [Pirellulales bacterium]|nr:hypothetical protein [Pirellulales bacterium]